MLITIMNQLYFHAFRTVCGLKRNQLPPPKRTMNRTASTERKTTVAMMGSMPELMMRRAQSLVDRKATTAPSMPSTHLTVLLSLGVSAE